MAAPAADNHANGQPISAMVFNSKGKFFLNLDEKAAAQPVTVAPVAKPAPKAAPKAETKPKAAAPVSIQAPAAAGTKAAATTESAAAPQGQVLTTAEAIAAELAADKSGAAHF